MKLDIKADEPGGGIVGCLRPALRTAGVDWSTEYLWGYLGPAFTFSMKENGVALDQTGNYQWSFFFEMLGFLNYDHIDASLKRIQDGGGEPPPASAVSAEKHARAKAEAWEKVRGAIDDGYPAIVWQAFTTEARESGQRPLPFLWALIVGYDEDAETYTVHHSGQGEFTIRWDAFGHSDPVNWFSVMLFRPQPESFDALAANRRAIERAIESSRGMRPGVKATAHGLAAWEMWLEAFQQGSVSVHHVSHHSDFLIYSRRAAAAYLSQIVSVFPENARVPLRDAAALYSEEVAAMEELRGLFAGVEPDLKKGAVVLSRALDRERAALAKLQQALEGS